MLYPLSYRGGFNRQGKQGTLQALSYRDRFNSKLDYHNLPVFSSYLLLGKKDLNKCYLLLGKKDLNKCYLLLGKKDLDKCYLLLGKKRFG